MFFKSNRLILILTLFVFMSFNVQSTIVEVRTSLGTIEVNLFDDTTPETVANFLSYANSGSYANTVVHRTVSGFVVQGGGFSYTGPIDINSFTLDAISTGTPVINDPKLSNVRGTIAMAKTSDPDSATSQWFINLSDNSNSLDIATNAGGFTVFGQVLGDGMQVIDAIADLTRLNAGGAFGELPIRNYTQTDVDNGVSISDEHLVVISDVVVTDSATDTAANLNPALNTLVNTPTQGGSSESGGGGGTVEWLLLLALVMLQTCRLRKTT